MRLYSIINRFFSEGHARSLIIKKNIVFSIIFRSLNILISIIIIPLTIDYLSPGLYGVWLTLTSIIGWIYYFDIGIGNGLRKKLAEVFVKNDTKEARKYVSTSYAILGIISIGIMAITLVIIPFLNWIKILNAPPEYAADLIHLVIIVFALFSLQLAASLIKMILLSDLRSSTNDLLSLLGSALSLILIIFLRYFTQGSLLYLGIAFSLSPLLVLVVGTVILFKRRYKPIRPSIKFIDWSCSRELLGDGVKFFVLQISAVMVFQTSNIIINQLFGPVAVTEFNIAYKYFSIALMVFLIILTPAWSAFSDAFVRRDETWMKNIYKNYIYISILFSFFIIIMLIASPLVYRIWIGDKVNIPFLLSAFVAFYAITNLWMSTFIYIINGIGKITLQVYASIFEIIFNIPLSIILGKQFGIIGILISMSFFVILRIIWAPIQVRKLISYNATGLWHR